MKATLIALAGAAAALAASASCASAQVLIYPVNSNACRGAWPLRLRPPTSRKPNGS